MGPGIVWLDRQGAAVADQRGLAVVQVAADVADPDLRFGEAGEDIELEEEVIAEDIDDDDIDDEPFEDIDDE